MSVLSIRKGHCTECYACVRVCPVKAIKTVSGQVEIIDERCIYCGRCVLACSRESIELGKDLEKAFTFLSTGKRTIAILAPEYLASFYPMSREQLAFLIDQAGFSGFEDTILGEEMVARQYLQYFDSNNDFPVIRSTCPAATMWIEKYYPDLNVYMASIISPMVAQAKITKGLYGDDIEVVYVTPCIAAKYEAKTYDSISAVLTFKEFKHLLIMRIIGLRSDFTIEKVARPEIRRDYSVAGGFPRPIIAQHNMLDSSLLVIRGVDNLDWLVDAISTGTLKAKFVDLLACDGCIDGPGMDTELSIHQRKHIVSEGCKNRLAKASEQLTFDQVAPYLPKIEMSRVFSNKKVNLPMPSESALREILIEGEKFGPADELNCGSCGYRTCREQAIAIYQGIADWGACFPFQKKVYDRMIAQLRETAVTDGLTGLANHKSFNERLAIEFNRAKRYGSELSLMMIDADRFKEINDSYGHITGDAVLKALAAILKGNIRQSDLAARYGGDEFALILPETNAEQAFKVGEKLRRKVEASPIQFSDNTIQLTLSIGVSSFSSEMNEPLDLIKKADEALYMAKEAGRNRTAASTGLKVE
ncbi:MAG: diguanylate cyclase [Actinomycetota bacterium]|nr:diguanylate cyclase [Actinomycetota bacterium]